MNEKKKSNVFYIIIVLLIIIFIGLAFWKSNYKNNKNNKEDDKKEQEEVVAIKDGVNIRINDIKCSKGDEISVEVQMLNDSDFVAANFEYIYDKDSLEYVSYEVGDSLQDGAMTMVNNDEPNSKILIGFIANPNGTKKVESGKLIILKFKVKDQSSANIIKNEFKSTTLKKEDGTDIISNIKQGNIEVQ